MTKRKFINQKEAQKQWMKMKQLDQNNNNKKEIEILNKS